MKNLITILIVLITFQNGFGQKNNFIGHYYNGLGTDLIINKDSTFHISHIPPLEGCVLEIFSSSGIWKSQNDTIILFPISDTAISNQFYLRNSSDTLSKDTIYFTIRSIFDDKLLPLANIIVYSDENKMIERTMSDFDGLGKLKKINFSYILVYYNGYYPIRINKDDLGGNNIHLKITVGGRETYLTENMYLLQRKYGVLKVIKGHKDGYTFRKLK